MGQGISGKINEFRKKFYRNLIVRGTLITFSIVLTFFLLANVLEYMAKFPTLVRGIILFSFVITLFALLYFYVVVPFTKSINPKKGIKDEEAARMIGSFFPEIRDKLLNIIQLQKIDRGENKLVQASIAQKSGSIVHLPFSKAIDLQENRKYLKFILPPIILALFLVVAIPQIFTVSTKRIVQFNKEFIPEAPFSFLVNEQKLLAFKNEDFVVHLDLSGKVLPENVYLISNGRKVKMNQISTSSFEYTFSKIQAEKRFYFESAGFSSQEYLLNIANRPNLKSFDVHINYPPYLALPSERFSNVGNLEIPEGSVVTWQFQILDADELKMEFKNSNAEIVIQKTDNQAIEAKRQFFASEQYEIKLKNEYSENSQKIDYSVTVIPDQYPDITLNVFQDTTLYSFLILAGNLEDDHGINRLSLFYQIQKEKRSSDFTILEIPLAGRQSSQSYYHEWVLNDLGLKEGDQINYYLQVWDNDGINGSKATKTGTYVFKIPTRNEIKKEIEASSNRSENKIEETLKEAQDLNKKLEEAENRLRVKKDLDWQDQNLLKEILDKKQKLDKALEELSKENKANDSKRQRFQEENERIREKVEQLQKLMDDLLDDETKKLYEELQKLLQENKSSEDFQKLLDQMNNKQDNLEKELERTLELFKKMKFEYKLNEAINDLEELSEKQKELADQVNEQDTLNTKGDEGDQGQENKEEADKSDQGDENSGLEKLSEEQKKLNEEFEDTHENIEEVQQLNQDLKNPKSMEDMSEDQKQIQENQQKSLQNLQNNQNKKASDSQRKAAQQMKQLSQKLQQMQNSMEMEAMTENMENLRDILHNLLQLSFDQEKLMNDFREINQSDPRFVEFSQNQLKIKDDAKIVEDSLRSLASRVFQIQSFVTREVGDMNRYIDESMEALKNRERNVIPVVTGKQQFAMTSMNNLALMLDDVLQQMQQAMADAMGSSGKGKGNMKVPSMSELQKQLNQQIQQLKQSGKSGRELSEELARLAAEQERIRRAVEEAKEKLNQGMGDNGELQELMEQMEETELDLVNKKLTEETVQRQKEILTRLLDAENSMRERDQDDEREGETAKSYETLVPKAFEDYFKLKEKEIELLKTVPLKLYPYYKKEVNEYFKRIENN